MLSQPVIIELISRMTAANESGSQTTTVVTDREGSGPVGDAGADMGGFFLAGALLNLILVGAYIVWAVKQWRRKSGGSG